MTSTVHVAVSDTYTCDGAQVRHREQNNYKYDADRTSVSDAIPKKKININWTQLKCLPKSNHHSALTISLQPDSFVQIEGNAFALSARVRAFSYLKVKESEKKN